ncbi:hypothetical protein [Catenuloplanes japonicus]|uniref:hypothetical protein n=1 Tax=Catenuloplanes japonicus TaxID=33876 RepID=UPI0005242B15|nr:hypothetical protein [Catenuloplanes japonicus]
MKSSVERTRDLLGPADPARGFDPVPPHPVHALITRADSAPEVIVPVRPGSPAETGPPRTRPRLARRTVLLGAAAGVAGVAAGSVALGRVFRADDLPGPVLGAWGDDDVVRPLAYEFGDGAAPAADRLRDLADRITPSASDGGEGRYTAVRGRRWERTILRDVPLAQGPRPDVTGTAMPPSTPRPPGTSDPAGTASPTDTGLPPGTAYPTAAWPTNTVNTPVPPRTGVPTHTSLPTNTAVPPRTGLPVPTRTPIGPLVLDWGQGAGMVSETWSWYGPGWLAETDIRVRLEFVSADARQSWYAAHPDPIEPGRSDRGYKATYPELPAALARTTDEVVASLREANPRETVDIAVLVRQRGTDPAGRAGFLRTLADVQPHWVWRGEVVDRVGRTGVAISRPSPELGPDEPYWHAGDVVLIFDPASGELIGVERMRQADGALDEYRVFTETRRLAESGRTW